MCEDTGGLLLLVRPSSLRTREESDLVCIPGCAMRLYMVRILTIRDLRSNLAKFIYNLLVPRTLFPLESSHLSVIAARHWNFNLSRHKHKAAHIVNKLRMKVSKQSIIEGNLDRMNKYVPSVRLGVCSSAQ